MEFTNILKMYVKVGDFISIPQTLHVKVGDFVSVPQMPCVKALIFELFNIH